MQMPKDRFCRICGNLLKPDGECAGCTAAKKRGVIKQPPLSEIIENAFMRNARLRKILEDERVFSSEQFHQIGYNKIPGLYFEALKGATLKGILYYRASKVVEVVAHPYAFVFTPHDVNRGFDVKKTKILSPDYGNDEGNYSVLIYENKAQILELERKISKQEIFTRDLPKFSSCVLVPSDFSIDMKKVPFAKNIDELELLLAKK